MGQNDQNRRLPVPVSEPYGSERAPRRAAAPRTEAAFAAQMLGQDGMKRGLKGGRPVLDAARAAYLGTEWSGPDDRRPQKGLLRKTEI